MGHFYSYSESLHQGVVKHRLSLIAVIVGVMMLQTQNHRAQKVMWTNNFPIMPFSRHFFVILYRIMFLYLGNMYVLVISLLNKINQVREMKICSFKPFLSRKCMQCLVGWLVGFFCNRGKFHLFGTHSFFSLRSLFAVEGFSSRGLCYLWCHEHNCYSCYHGYVKCHSW